MQVAPGAGAQRAEVWIGQRHGRRIVTVSDDGVGFDLTDLSLEPDSMRGLGLVGMQERVELLGGEVEVNTVPGFGTQVHIHLPLKEKEPDVA